MAHMHERLKGYPRNENESCARRKESRKAFREAHTFKPKKTKYGEKLALASSAEENDDSMKCVKTTTRVNDGKDEVRT